MNAAREITTHGMVTHQEIANEKRFAELEAKIALMEAHVEALERGELWSEPQSEACLI
jgi:hypothetical protein